MTPTVWVAFPSDDGEQNSIAEHGANLVSALKASGVRAELVGIEILQRRDLPREDVVWLQYNPFAFERWGVAPQLLRRVLDFGQLAGHPRLCLCIHEPYIPMQPNRTLVPALWQRVQLRILIRASDEVVAVSESWQRIARRFARSEVAITHVPVGSNLPDRRAARKDQRAALGIDPETVVVAQFGTDHPSRLDAHVIASMELLTASRVPSVLLNLGRTARPLTVDAEVSEIRPGELDADALARHLACADLFMSPCVDGVSTRRTSVMAALQHGVPVVGTQRPETDAVMREDPSMRLVAVEDVAGFAHQVKMLAVDVAARERASASARALYLRAFDWRVIGRQAAYSLGISTCV